MTSGGWMQRLKRFGTQSRWWKQRYAPGGDITKKAKEMQIRGVERAYGAKEMYGERISHFRSDQRADNPSTL